jgi:MraZ protein
VAVHVEWAVLQGDYDLTIDEKNRLLIPAEFRKELERFNDATEFAILPGADNQPWIIPYRIYQAIVTQQRQELKISIEQFDYEDQIFGMSRKVEADKAGRILMPDALLVEKGIAKEVTVTGANWFMKVWNRPDWKTRKSELNAKLKDLLVLNTRKGLPDVGNAQQPSG